MVLKKVPIPYLPDRGRQGSSSSSSLRRRATQSTWCGTIHPITEPTKSKSVSTSMAPKPGDEIVKGELLYAARIARFDLLRSINMLARNVTKWTKLDDIKLHHLMSCVKATKGQNLIGWVGTDLKSLQIFIAADYSLQTHAIRVVSLWKTLVGRDPKIIFHDDNQGMIAIVRSGQSPIICVT